MSSFIDTIYSLVWDLWSAFFSAAQTVQGWVWPFNQLQTPLYGIANLVKQLLTPIAHFHDWIVSVETYFSQILSWSAIYNLILQYFPGLAAVIEWFKNVTWNIYQAINGWWSSVSTTVQGWINVAVQGFRDLLDNLQGTVDGILETWSNFWTVTWPSWTSRLDGLAAAWGNFTSSILPTLTPLSVVNILIQSTISAMFPWYNTLASIINIAGAFFGSPLDWLLDHFEDWFWGEE